MFMILFCMRPITLPCINVADCKFIWCVDSRNGVHIGEDNFNFIRVRLGQFVCAKYAYDFF